MAWLTRTVASESPLRAAHPPWVLVWVHLREIEASAPWSPICHFKYQQSLVWRDLAVVRYGNGQDQS